MDHLEEDEKYFVSCFVERCNDLLRPSLGKIFSLHTFIDGGKPHHKQQDKRLIETDPYIAERLQLISDRVDDEAFYKKQVKKLKLAGFSISKTFEINFRVISEWFWLVESDTVRARVRRLYNQKLEVLEIARIERDEIRRKFLLAKAEEENIYFKMLKKNNESEKAMQKIAKSRIIGSAGIVRPPKISKIPPGILRPSGSQICFICNGFGKTSAGRHCNKCSGRGFVRN